MMFAYLIMVTVPLRALGVGVVVLSKLVLHGQVPVFLHLDSLGQVSNTGIF